jgi:hypothetical protein
MHSNLFIYMNANRIVPCPQLFGYDNGVPNRPGGLLLSFWELRSFE